MLKQIRVTFILTEVGEDIIDTITLVVHALVSLAHGHMIATSETVYVPDAEEIFNGPKGTTRSTDAGK